jgi:tetratricopeptide (TPR) repeat protein
MDGTERDNKGQAGANGSPRRLRSWKEIAAYFGTDERTVKRWEARGLPVQRVPGGTRTPVYADTLALDQWMRGTSEAPAPAEAAPATMAQRPARPRLFAGASLAVVLAIGAGAFAYSRSSPSGAPLVRHQPSARAVDLYTAGIYQSERSTPDSLRRAIALYGQAIAEDPGYADPYAALANAYIRLRVFAAVTEAEAYPRAKAAAQRAIELDPNLSQAHNAMGYVSFYSDWDFERGLHHFGEAARLDPRSATSHYQYSMALLHAGDFATALREIEAAQRLDPRARGILADKGFILYVLGRKAEGVALIRQVAADDPDYMLSHQYLSLIHLAEGNWRDGLAEAERVARMRQDANRLALAAPARRALAQGGGEAMMRAVLAGQQRLHAQGREPAYVLAETHAMLGERDAALRYLRQSIAVREPLALTMRIDPLLHRLRGDPEFNRLAAQVGAGS